MAVEAGLRPEPTLGRDALVLAASAPLAPALAAVLGNGWPALLLAATLAWVFLLRHRGAPRGPVVAGLLLWAAVLSACFVGLTLAAPERAALAIPHAPAYWDEMRPWLWTGEGRESSPAQFVPVHALHLAAFVVLAAATGGWAGLVLGAYLLGFMSFYVGKVAGQAEHGLLAGLAAWHPWAVLRVVAFVLLGVALSRLLLDRGRVRDWWRDERRAVGLALGLWLADLVLKAALAPAWSRLLRGLIA